jgi:hypothetical protein
LSPTAIDDVEIGGLNEVRLIPDRRVLPDAPVELTPYSFAEQRDREPAISKECRLLFCL